MIKFDKEKVLLLQQLVIKSSGGSAGVRDFGLLDSAIESAYQSSPFFEYYQEDLRPFFEPQKFKYLYDFNIELQNTICNLLNIHPQIEYSSEYVQPQESDIDLREVIHPKRPIIEQEKLLSYYQVFSSRHGFIPDLSIIDLLFNMGPESIFLLLSTPKEI